MPLSISSITPGTAVVIMGRPEPIGRRGRRAGYIPSAVPVKSHVTSLSDQLGDIVAETEEAHRCPRQLARLNRSSSGLSRPLPADEQGQRGAAVGGLSAAPAAASRILLRHESGRGTANQSAATRPQLRRLRVASNPSGSRSGERQCSANRVDFVGDKLQPHRISIRTLRSPMKTRICEMLDGQTGRVRYGASHGHVRRRRCRAASQRPGDAEAC